MITAEDLIRKFDLHPLPMEGGYFHETFRSDTPVGSERPWSTAIYYLLTPDTRSALHRLPSDEVFHFYYGDPVEVLILEQAGRGRIVTLGNDPEGVFCPQLVVPAGVWQGSSLAQGGRLAFMGTTVAPGFDFSDLEIADAQALVADYPDFAEKIRLLAEG